MLLILIGFFLFVPLTTSQALGYTLKINSTQGGNVTQPGEGTFTYTSGTEVDLLAEANDGYNFDIWTGDIETIEDVSSRNTTITMNNDYNITATFEKTAINSLTDTLSMLPFVAFLVSPTFLYLITFSVTIATGILATYYLNSEAGLFVMILWFVLWLAVGWIPRWVSAAVIFILVLIFAHKV